MFKSRSHSLIKHNLQKQLVYFFSNSYKFKLPKDFLNTFKQKPVNFGFNGLGELVYKRTYSRIKEDNTNEEWFETVQRVVEGTYSLLVYIVL